MGSVNDNDQKTAIADADSPEMQAVRAKIEAARAAQAAPPSAAPQEQKTAIADMNAPDMAAVQAKIAAARAAQSAAPPAAAPVAAAPKPVAEQSTAIFDSSSPQLAAVQAQIAAATRAATPAGSGPPPSAPGGGQSTVMLDSPIVRPPLQAPGPAPAPAPVRSSTGGARQLLPLQAIVKPQPQTWQRWVIGPGVMLLCAGLTWFVLGIVMPAQVVKPVVTPPPPKPKPLGKLQLKTTPPGATIQLADQTVPRFTPTVVEWPAGETVHLTLSLEGYRPHEEQLRFSADERQLAVTLEKIPEVKKVVKRIARPVGTGTISIFVRPVADVFVDGNRIRQTPIASHELSTGRHTFTLVNDRLHKKVQRMVEIKAGVNPEIREDFTQ